MALTVTLALLAMVGLPIGTGNAATSAVIAADDYFWSWSALSSTVTVRAGDTVTWQNNGDHWHNVVADDGGFQSGTLQRGATYSRVFSQPGTYTYSCTLHQAENMVGKVIVQAAGSSTPTATPWSLFIPYVPA